MSERGVASKQFFLYTNNEGRSLFHYTSMHHQDNNSIIYFLLTCFKKYIYEEVCFTTQNNFTTGFFSPKFQKNEPIWVLHTIIFLPICLPTLRHPLHYISVLGETTLKKVQRWSNFRWSGAAHLLIKMHHLCRHQIFDSPRPYIDNPIEYICSNKLQLQCQLLIQNK